MPVIENVNIDDVYPWEDEYGNEFLSRDYSTKENQRYVQRLADSMRARGVPDEPVQLSRDGGIYRIVSGNSRVRAMRLLGTKRFDAVVLDDEEAGQAMRRAVEVTVRTNTKKAYDAVEESRFVQQLAMFKGDEYVAEAAGIDAEQVRRIRRGREAVGDDAEEMSLFRLAAIAEFEGDEKAVEALTACKEREVEWIVRDLRREAQRAREREAIAAALEAAGIVVLSKQPEGAVFCAYVCDPEGVPETGGPLGPTFAVANPATSGFALYRTHCAEDTAREAEEAARREEAELAKAADMEAATAGRERREAWLVGRLANFDPGKLPNLAELAEACLTEDYPYADDAHRALVEANARPTVGSMDVLAAAMSEEVAEYGIWSHWNGRSVNLDRAHAFLDLMDAMVADGYEPDEGERAMYDEAAAAVGRA